MAYTILFLYVFVILLALLEDHMGSYKKTILFFIGCILVILAGFREIGIDPDSLNYEAAYHFYDKKNSIETVEFSYIIFSYFFNMITSDAHAIMLFYALLGVSLKLYAFSRYSSRLFIMVIIYISYYFILHECMQIRTGVLAALYLIMLMYLAEGKRLYSMIIIIIGTFFHYSGLVLLPLLLFSNKPLKKFHIYTLLAIVPSAYIIYAIGFSILNLEFSALPLVGAKLTTYQQSTENGTSVTGINVFSPLNLLTIAIYYYLIFFHKLLEYKNRFFPILIKAFAIAIFTYIAFSFFPVVTERLKMLYQTVTIVLYACIYYTIRPRWLSILLVSSLALLLLNYSLVNIDFTLFWKV